jgi:hypothetical protein
VSPIVSGYAGDLGSAVPYKLIRYDASSRPCSAPHRFALPLLSCFPFPPPLQTRSTSCRKETQHPVSAVPPRTEASPQLVRPVASSVAKDCRRVERTATVADGGPDAGSKDSQYLPEGQPSREQPYVHGPLPARRTLAYRGRLAQLPRERRQCQAQQPGARCVVSREICGDNC